MSRNQNKNKNKNKNLLYILADLKFFFSHRQWLAMDAKKAGFNTHIACPDADKSEKLKEMGFFGHHLPIDGGGMNPVEELKTTYRIYQLINSTDCDIVQGIGLKSIVPTSFASFFKPKVKSIYLFTGLGYLFTNQSRKVRAIRQFLIPFLAIAFRKKNAVLIFQNNDDYQEFLDNKLMRPEQAVLIRGSGVDVNVFTPQPNTKNKNIIVLMPGRLVGDKGAREFIEAAKIIKQKQLNIRLTIAGDRDPKNPSCLSTEELEKAKPYVDILGYQTDMKSLYAASDIICLPSYREGLPKALLEAAACARPLIAADAPGSREIVIPNENGILVPVKNSNALAQAILTLANSPELRGQYGRNARKLVEEELSLEKVNAKMIEIYKA